LRRSARFARRAAFIVEAPDAAMDDPFDAALVAPVCDHAQTDARAINTPQADLRAVTVFIEVSSCYGPWDQNV
jgi:hypothetical protein